MAVVIVLVFHNLIVEIKTFRKILKISKIFKKNN